MRVFDVKCTSWFSSIQTRTLEHNYEKYDLNNTGGGTVENIEHLYAITKNTTFFTAHFLYNI